MKKGFMKRNDEDVNFYNARKGFLRSFCTISFSKLWPGIRKLTPLRKYIPIEYHSVPDSFTIKIVKDG